MVNSLPSLQVALGQALHPLMVDLADRDTPSSGSGNHGPRASSTEDGAYPSLRLSRDRATIAYLCRPRQSGVPPSPDLAAAILCRWQATLAGQPPLLPLSDWIQPHTLGEAWPTGQLLLTPQPLALAGWLWLWAVQSGSAATNRPDPKPALRSALEPASLLPPQFPLAQRLQLSPLALLEYTQARCHHLAQISHAAALFSHRGSVAPLATWVPVAPQGQAVLRALAQFTDGLATLPAPTAQGGRAGLDLCAAVDGWLRTVVGTPSVGDGILLAAIAHSLRHFLCQGPGIAAPDTL